MSRYDHPADDSAYEAATSDPADRYAEDEDIQSIDPLALAEGDLSMASATMKLAILTATTPNELNHLRHMCRAWEQRMVALTDAAATRDNQIQGA